ncbi:ATP-binding protein [Phenylobacterium sp.]|uniref:ATP-binding protein n=1 Tax=Phenylobacterium sp. TaxID=1871053 RepID=UPI002B8FCBB3|nr:ATP-binding protein [Phenylobacterium sp.]HVI31014.1 ATP-binding protein [Phenylobacterium sp.]
MDEETLARAIEPFFSTKAIRKGTGLGLSMVHGLVGQLGGALMLQRRLAVGSTFELWLPLAAHSSAAEPTPRHRAASGPRAPRILEGEDLLLAADQVQPLSVIVHELATNAVKYGAFSVDAGRVQVSWRASKKGLLELTWRETDGPAVEGPGQAGFGSRLLKALPSQLQASLEVAWRREGLTVRLHMEPPRGAG